LVFVVVAVLVRETVDVLDWLELLETEIELLPVWEFDAELEPDSLGDTELDTELESDNELIELIDAEELSDGE